MIHTNNNFLFLGSVYFEPHGNEWAHKIGGTNGRVMLTRFLLGLFNGDQIDFSRSDKPLDDGSFEITLV